jgi:menaquinone-dependent protoporphyrinogen oxidase
MRVLVTYASRHGATADIAEVVAAALRDNPAGDEARRVDVLPLEEVEDIAGYDAVVLGAAVYSGRWMPQARAFLHENGAVLRDRQVWLFSSGPIGLAAGPEQDTTDTEELIDLVQPQGYGGFAGRLRRADLDLDERLTVGRLHAAEGDYRDWTRIREWADEIADGLAVPTASRAES